MNKCMCNPDRLREHIQCLKSTITFRGKEKEKERKKEKTRKCISFNE
jgi:hypothetical protein